MCTSAASTWEMGVEMLWECSKTGMDTSSTDAPRPSSTSAAARTASTTSVSVRSKKYSLGTPTRTPLIPSSSPLQKSSGGLSMEWESRGSCPAMTFITSAASRTVRVMGPTVSKLQLRG